MSSSNSNWHSLLYSTGILLLLCGVPGIIGTAFLLCLGGELGQKDAFQFAWLMLIVVVPLGSGLWAIAIYLSKRGGSG
jgi:hypothetical protein